MSITLIRFPSETPNVQPKDDAILHHHMIGQSGILEGCEITHLGGNQLLVSAGRGIVYGRDFVIEEETILATVSDSGTKKGRLVVQIDISNSATPISFVTQMAAALPELTQEDINHDGAVYQMALAEYDIGTVAISNFVDVHDDVPPVPPHEHAATDITSGTLPIARGGTGGTTAADARTALGAEGSLNTDQKRKITISSASPSGGEDGDIWLKYS
jgi:hypothetical protein